MSNLDFIREHIPRSALWDQLGEELAELIQALYKLRRAEGNGNPTPVTVTEASAAVQEEISDVVNCCMILDFTDMRVDFKSDTMAGLFYAGELTTNKKRCDYTPMIIGSALNNLKAEGYNIDFDPESPKLARWVERIKEAQK